MLDDNFDADENQDQTANKFGVPAESPANAFAKIDADQRHSRGDEAYGRRRTPDFGADDRQAQPHGERVDARRQRQQHQAPAARRVERILPLLLFKTLPDHFAADPGQQRQRDPMIDGLDITHNRAARQPAENRHEKLKQAKMKRDAKARAFAF